MRKILLSGFFSLLLTCILFGQTAKRDATNLSSNYNGPMVIPVLNNTCDSIGWPFAVTDSVRNYTIGGNNGYLAGTNQYGDIAKGNFFDLTGGTANFISRAIMGLGFLNGANGGNGSKAVNIKILDGSTGSPGPELGAFNSTISGLKDRALNFSIITFSPAIPIPAEKKFFLVIEFSSLTWNTTADATSKDTLSMLTTAIGRPSSNLAWEQFDNGNWVRMSTSWGFGNLNIHLYPLVSATADGCTLPVTFGQFDGALKNGVVDLFWNTWTETNNDRFEIERATKDLKFVKIGTVASKAINGLSEGYKEYSFRDVFPSEGENYYRVRQVDRDGNSSFSKTVSIQNDPGGTPAIVRSYYPNPTSSQLIMQLAPGTEQVRSIRFADPSGKIISSLGPQTAPNGTLNVATGHLRSGLYLLTLTLADGQHQTIKIMHQ